MHPPHPRPQGYEASSTSFRSRWVGPPSLRPQLQAWSLGEMLSEQFPLRHAMCTPVPCWPGGRDLRGLPVLPGPGLVPGRLGFAYQSPDRLQGARNGKTRLRGLWVCGRVSEPSAPHAGCGSR